MQPLTTFAVHELPSLTLLTPHLSNSTTDVTTDRARNGPMDSRQFRYCLHCEQRIPLTIDWQFCAHYVDQARCDGSMQPAERPVAAQNRHGSRWR